MFSEKLENLIKAALQDGVLTEQEKAAIIKRAQAEGEDIDEVEIYIQSLMQKRQQELNQNNKGIQAAQAKKEFEYEKKRSKDLRKCPKCGSFIPQLSTVCPECGHIIDKNETDEKMVFLIRVLRKYLQKIIDDGSYYDSHYQEKIPRKDYERYMHLIDRAWDYEDKKKPTIEVDYNFSAAMAEAYLYKDNDEIRKLLDQIEEAKEKIKRKKSRASYKIGKFFSDIIDSCGGCLLVILIFTVPFIFLWGVEKCNNAPFQDLSEKVTECIKTDNLIEAKQLLLNIDISNDRWTSDEKYDQLYLNVISAFIKHEDYDSAEELGLMLRSNYSSKSAWKNFSTRQYIITTFKKIGRDYSSFLIDDVKNEEIESNDSTQNENSEDSDSIK